MNNTINKPVLAAFNPEFLIKPPSPSPTHGQSGELFVSYRNAAQPDTEIKLAVLAEFQLTEEDFFGKSKAHEVVTARQVYAWLCKTKLGFRIQRIAHNLHRERTTVIWAIKKIEGYLSYGDSAIVPAINRINEKLK